MAGVPESLAQLVWDALGGPAAELARLSFHGDGALPSAFAVTDLAAASIGCAALAAAELLAQIHPHARNAAVAVDRRLASFWFDASIRPLGWQVPPLRDPLTGDYRTRDGWLRVHANAPHHHIAAQRVLRLSDAHTDAAAAIAEWDAGALEQAIIAAGGCAAEMRDADAWRAHPQGSAVWREPLIAHSERPAGALPSWIVPHSRPLTGVRVLDLTRVLAGPVSTRFLAGLGASVLRIDPPSWDEPGVVPDVTLGKRCARLDLKTAAGRDTFAALLERADVLVHGLRPDALDALGFGPAERARLAPGLIDVSLDAYGWSGPWALRRGFDSLVQMSSGIAAAGMRWRGADKPVPLPVQALDHTTGYLLAAAALRGLTRRLTERVATRYRVSLARTAALLLDAPAPDDATSLAPESAADLAAPLEETSWGPARRIATPWRIDGVEVRWDLPASALGSAPPRWPG